MIINHLKTLVEAADESFYTSVVAVMKQSLLEIENGHLLESCCILNQFLVSFSFSSSFSS